MHLKKTLAQSLGAAALFLAASTSVSAQAYVENPDAGQTVATASFTGPLNFVPLIAISGNLPPSAGVSVDVDFFLITINNPAAFSASTANVFTTAGMDTQIFLLTLMGVPIILNDDAASGTTLASTIPAGSLNIGANTYILGISLNGIDPATAAGQLLFANGLSTDLRGPNPFLTGPLGSFVDQGFANTGGAYQINLTGVTAVAVPETSTVLAGLFALAALGFVWIRRNRTPALALQS